MMVPELSTAASEPQILEVTSNAGPASNLVPGTSYSVALSATFAGVAEGITHTGIYVPGLAPPFLTHPAASYQIASNGGFPLDFELPSSAVSSSVQLILTRTSGAADSGSPHVLTFQPSFETQGTNAAIMPGLLLRVPLTASHLPSRPQVSTRWWFQR